MLSLYQQAIMDDINQAIEHSHISYKIYVEKTTNELSVRLNKGTLDFPTVGVLTRYELIDEAFDKDVDGDLFENKEKYYRCLAEISKYSTIDINNNNNIYKYDFAKAMPIRLDVSVTIVTTEIPHIVEIEDIILNRYSTYQKLTIPHPEIADEQIPFEIIVDHPENIERDHGDNFNTPNGMLYQSIIHLKCKGYVPEFFKSYHPAQVAFDNDLQLDIVKKICNLKRINMYLYKRITKLQPKKPSRFIREGLYRNSDKNVTEEQIKMWDAQKKAWEEHTPSDEEMELKKEQEKISTTQEKLFSIANIPQNFKVDIGNIYEIMAKSNCSIKEAIDEFDEIVRQVEEKDRQYVREEEERRAREAQLEAEERAERLAARRESIGNGEGLLSGIIKTAIGTSIGTRSMKKESQKQTQLMREQAELMREQTEREEKILREREFQSRMRRDAVIKENQERRRKGLPQLPIPPIERY